MTQHLLHSDLCRVACDLLDPVQEAGYRCVHPWKDWIGAAAAPRDDPCEDPAPAFAVANQGPAVVGVATLRPPAGWQAAHT